jgi:hypothetical protein
VGAIEFRPPRLTQAKFINKVDDMHVAKITNVQAGYAAKLKNKKLKHGFRLPHFDKPHVTCWPFCLPFFSPIAL